MNTQTIKNKITIMLFLCSIIPLILVWGLSFFIAKQESQLKTEEHLLQNLGNSSKLFNNFINQQLLLNQTFAELLPKDKSYKEFLIKAQSKYPWINAIYITDSMGQQISRSNEDKLSNIEDREYFKQAKYMNRTSFIASISKANGLPSVISGSPILQENQFQGVIGISSNLSQVNDSSNYSFSKTGFSFVVNKKGEVIMHPTLGKNGVASLNEHPLFKLIINEKNDFVAPVHFNFENKNFIGTAKKFYDGNIIIITTIEEKEIGESITKMNFIYFGILLASIIFSYVIAIILANKFSKSIEKLTEISDMITKGNFQKEWNDFNNEPKEIQELAMSVKKLSLAVQIAIQKLIKESKDKK